MSACKNGIAPGDAPARLLTREQYDNTVRDLLGDDSMPASKFPVTATVEGFENNAELNRANPLLVSQYLRTSEALAQAAIDRGLDRYLPCGYDTADPKSCGEQFIDQFAFAAYRRPLELAEKDGLVRLFESTLTAHDFPTAIKLVIETVLQSPQFLYRIDSLAAPTPESGAIRLGPWEMASRLSYFLWNSMPDDELFDAAKKNALSDPDAIERQARRMLDDPKARSVVLDFHRQWLGLDRFDGLARDAPDFQDIQSQLPASFRGSLEAFIDDVYWNEGGDVNALFTSSTVFVDATLAELFGVQAPTDGFAKVKLDKGDREGLLMQPGLLTLLAHPSQTSPTRRGVFVREQVLCDEVPPPPPDVDPTPPDPDPNLTTRDRFKVHTAEARCATCHDKMDPIGWGLENYDAIGRFRADENGIPIDSSGYIADVKEADVEGPFNGPSELAHRLANSKQVQNCIALQWYRYAMGRIEGPSDACSLAQARAAFEDSGGNFKELLVGLTRTDAFLYRPPGEQDQ